MDAQVASADSTSTSGKAGQTVELKLMSISGETLGLLALPTCWTVQQLKAHICQEGIANKEAGSNAFSLVHGDSVLQDASIVLEVLPPPSPVAYLVQQKKRLHTAKDIHGAHTGNPQYFKRNNEGTYEEDLELRDVCWFQVGTTFPSVPAGTYNVMVEAAKASSGWSPFEMQVRPTGDTWAPGECLKEEFQTFHVAELVLDNATDEVRVDLFCTTGNWKRGLKIRSLALE
eukprot:gnl/MRDRNA2_/MRDRNA2_58938_c0_seq1.p1 gnl/MRDRNA2_/MRDRNA2_58938_c0~~gnl/MRDRNA2_/MRDRNA2_58938_c0_seq1.p1  ORF type:complete len:230 (+),score=49.63 gnl/MRDRNA2_/MRDRNA2_58938_c0_seq1:114-803(+)